MPGDPVVGWTILRRPAIQSPNYVAGTSGWTVNADGSAEFNNLAIRGTFNGTDYVINSAGAFFYSGTPAAGNLIASVSNFAGADAYGNHYLAGEASYQAGFASAVIGGAVLFYTGSLAGGWTFQAQVLIDGSGNLLLEAGAGGIVDVAGNLSVSGNATITGTLTVGGSTSTGTPSNNSTSTNGLPNGTISGTSGAASAGTAHTHDGGSYAVTDGRHSHDLSSHTHPL